MVVSEFPGLAQDLDLILDHAQIFMMNRATDGTILRMSEKWARVLGTTRHRAEGENFFKIAPLGTADAIKESDAQLMESQTGKLRHVLSVISKETDEAIWMNSENFFSSDPVLGDPSIYSIGTDVTEVVKAKETAEEALGQLILLQDLAKVGFWSLNPRTQKVFWSEEVYRLHGKDPENYAPTLDGGLEFYHPEDRADVTQEVNRVLQKGGDFHFVKRIIADDGVTRTVESFGLGQADQTGRITKVIGVFREVHDMG
jgi:two-component system CheB/CheR fusion protein